MICNKCPRLCQFIQKNKELYPNFFNAPVPNFGDEKGILLIVGLAPGLKGANRTGRPFTGDYAGIILYETLLKFGWANGTYEQRADDGLQLKNALITNAVACVPPENKPTPQEINTCNERLKSTIKNMKHLRVILSLGRISHQSVIKAFCLKQSAFPFAHGNVHHLLNGICLIDSYHCSRYNINTGQLTQQMFDKIFETINKLDFN
ncbi:MAG: uracil-DNA glycosylase [Alphaproteobacteria bacterium]|nr:uracil-DNA glycosylase [Alphaproteobacteria bacterium]